MTYDLRRLRLHSLIERIPRTHRYHLTRDGLRVALFFTRAYTRLLRPSLSTQPTGPHAPPGRRDPTSAALARLQTSFDQLLDLCQFDAA